MSTGTYGQQVIDTVRSAHYFMHEGFGDFYLVALALSALLGLLWFAKQVRSYRQVRARRGAAAARAKSKASRKHLKAA